jgi:hypothetical protein
MAAGLVTGGAAGFFSESGLLRLVAADVMGVVARRRQSHQASHASPYSSQTCDAGVTACSAGEPWYALAERCAWGRHRLPGARIRRHRSTQDNVMHVKDWYTGSVAESACRDARAGRLPHRPSPGEAGTRHSRRPKPGRAARGTSSRPVRQHVTTRRSSVASLQATQPRQHSCCDRTDGGQLAEEQARPMTWFV